ncbi:hypothetical protein GS4_03_01140 [Gordonia soli NBRC 108243]|uniref:Uncharacterized protein n=1 Tax=Gordonia soli NBRC 108243 TaxID=1223545 RepID=M0QEA6_9ACTN|nr:hypothetical protein GS4_03_01140 [Gordonia soli NBRC 108243]
MVQAAQRLQIGCRGETTRRRIVVVERAGVIEIRRSHRIGATGEGAAQLACPDESLQSTAGRVGEVRRVRLFGVHVTATRLGEERSHRVRVDHAGTVEPSGIVVEADQGGQVHHDVEHRAR